MANSQTRNRFDLDDSYPYYTMLRQKLAGEVDSWGILWWYAVFNAGGLVLHPRRSLVWVGGFDGTGTHWKKAPDFQQPSRETFTQKSLPYPLTFPERVFVNEVAFDRVKSLFQAQLRTSQPSLLTRIRRKIRQCY